MLMLGLGNRKYEESWGWVLECLRGLEFGVLLIVAVLAAAFRGCVGTADAASQVT